MLRETPTRREAAHTTCTCTCCMCMLHVDADRPAPSQSISASAQPLSISDSSSHPPHTPRRVRWIAVPSGYAQNGDGKIIYKEFCELMKPYELPSGA
jgi:hypothetical protein